jgi:hypothetical protein
MRKPFIVCVQDTEVRVREYVTMAHDESHAKSNIADGVYITESAPETVDTIETVIISCEEIENGEK